MRLFAVLLVAALLPSVRAQQEPTSPSYLRLSEGVQIRLAGTAQVRAEYSHDEADPDEIQDRIGVGIRRLRLRLYADVGPKLTVFGQAEGAASSISVLDLRVGYKLAKPLTLVAGRFVGAQPSAFAVTLHNDIDAIDRPVTASQWAQQTLGADGRDFGVELRYEVPALYARLFVHNGDGSWDRARGNFREDLGPSSATGGVEHRLVAVSSAVTVRPAALPGFEVGAFAGYNPSENPNTAVTIPAAGGPTRTLGRAYTSFAGHAYWGRLPGSQPVRLKADVIGWRFRSLDGVGTDTTAVPAVMRLGGSALAAVRPAQGVELFARAEHFRTDAESAASGLTFLTGGLSFSPSARAGKAFSQQRLSLGWTSRLRGPDALHDAYQFTVQAQVVF